MAQCDDAELLRLLAAELRLDGGVSELSMLPTYNPRIRKLLGERKLWGVVREYPRYFDCFERASAGAACATDGAGATAASALLVRLLEVPAPAARAVVTAPPGGWPHHCSGCNAGFGSRNALFKHLRGAGACPAATSSTLTAPAPAAAGGRPVPVGPLGQRSTTAKALVVAVQGVLRDQQQAGPVPLPWVVTPAKSRGALRRFVRESGALATAAEMCPPSADGGDVVDNPECGSLEPFQPRWWLVAMRALHALLGSLPSLFELSQPACDTNGGTSLSPLSSADLRSCTVMEIDRRPQVGSQDAAAAMATEAKSAAAVILRVVQLLEWQETKSGRRRTPDIGAEPRAAETPAEYSCAPPVSLGVLARDKGLQKHLGCRPLLPLLQAQCAQLQSTSASSSDGGIPWSCLRRLRLVVEPTRGWCAQLLPSGSNPSAEATVSPDATRTNARAGGGLTSASHFQSHDPEILEVFPGAVALNKPCGVSTEAVIDWLQHDPPGAVRKELERGEALEHRPTGSDAVQSQRMERSPDTIDQRAYRLESVSRLDKPTSGILIVPLSRTALHCLTEQFRTRSVEKTYLCLCQGVVEPEAGSFNAKLRTLSRGRGSKTAPHPQGKEALTEYRRLDVYSASDAAYPCRRDTSTKARSTSSQEHAADIQKQQLFSLCEVYPRTGRTHQIRAHFASSGYPLVGDVKYGGPPLPSDTCSEGATGRLFLHSARLRFTTANDDTQERVQHEVDAPLPPVLSAVLEGMTKILEDTDSESQ
jgi:23S rRNA-/tRNA-specific pseudouridylate synthase